MNRQPRAVCRVVRFGAVVVAGVIIGKMLLAARWRHRFVDDLEHDLRGPMAVIRGEVELVLSQPDASPEDRRRSRANVIDQVEHMEQLLARRGSQAAD